MIQKLFLVLLVGIIACNEEVKHYELSIDVQSTFNNDVVEVFIDGDQIINQQFQTIPTLGVSFINGQARTTLIRFDGDHSIKIVVNGLWTKSEKIKLTSNLYLGIGYDQSSNQITINRSNEAYLYD